MRFEEMKREYTALVDSTIDHCLAPDALAKAQYGSIYDAARYSAVSSGKRIRPLILLAFCEMCGGKAQAAAPFAAALEMIHTYSLIHDDLPCMDDDDLRRGKPTNHKVFGEALAVLAGDALLTRAFEVAANLENAANLPAEAVLKAVSLLAKAAGMDGMIAGQVIDMESEGKEIDVERLTLLQQRKTGCLIQAAAVIGAVCAGVQDERTLAAAEMYGACVGQAFQIQDDILDIEGNPEIFGKPIGSDAENGKCTFPALLGMDRCKELVASLTQDALNAVETFENHDFLVCLAQEMINRVS